MSGNFEHHTAKRECKINVLAVKMRLIMSVKPVNLHVAEVTALPDPCPLPGSKKRRGQGDKDRLPCFSSY